MARLSELLSREPAGAARDTFSRLAGQGGYAPQQSQGAPAGGPIPLGAFGQQTASANPFGVASGPAPSPQPMGQAAPGAQDSGFPIGPMEIAQGLLALSVIGIPIAYAIQDYKNAGRFREAQAAEEIARSEALSEIHANMANGEDPKTATARAVKGGAIERMMIRDPINAAKELEAIQMVLQGPKPTASDLQKFRVGNQEVAQRQNQTTGAYETIGTGDLFAPQQPQEEPAAIRTLRAVARMGGYDLNTPEGLDQAIQKAAQLEQSTVMQYSMPSGYGLTGRTVNGLPETAPLPGTKEAEGREASTEAQERAAKTLDTVIQAFAENPSEFGLLGGLKEIGRAVTGAAEQLGQAGSGVVPGASMLEGAAGAARRGPLGEPEKGLTRSEVQAALDRLSLEIARTGVGGNEQRVAQQEINNVRAAMDAGGADITTVVRKLGIVRDIIYGEGLSSNSSGARSEDYQSKEASGPPLVQDKEAYAALPKGAEYVTVPGGEVYIKRSE